MTTMLRWKIRCADFNPTRVREQSGLHPVLTFSYDVSNERSGTVITLMLTNQSQKAGFPLILKLKPKNLSEQSWLKVSQIRTLSVDRIRNLNEISHNQQPQFSHNSAVQLRVRHY